MFRAVLISLLFQITSCYSQDSIIRSRVYSPNVYWIKDSAYCLEHQKYYSNGQPLGEFQFSENGQLVGQKQYSKNGVLLLEANVNSFDTFNLEYETLYRVFIDGKTYYENGNLRTELRTSRSKFVCKVFNSKGRFLYKNFIKNNYTELADTVRGVYRTNSYYTWIEYQIFDRHKLEMTFLVPLTFMKIAINEPDSAEEKCKERYCITYISEDCSRRRIRKYDYIIEEAIRNELITSLSNCYMQY